MSDIKNSVLPEIIEPISNAIQQNIPETAKAMDNRKVHQVHRSYVDAVKQMEPLDAQVLRRIYDYNEVTTSHVRLYKSGSQQYYLNAMPYHYNDILCDLGDPFQISASISNLIRLGLLISTAGFLKEGVAERIEKEPYIQERFGIYNQLQGGVTISVPVDCEIISLDSYGRYFVDVCMSKKKLGSNTD